MIAFAAMVERLGRDPAAWDRWAAGAAPADLVAAGALLAGVRPRRVAGADALMVWAAEVAGVPEWVLADCLAESGDKAEVAALLLAAPVGAVPGLAEVVQALERATRVSAHGVMLGLWARVPARAAVVVNRLASGTFRAKAPALVGAGPQGSLRAVVVQAGRGELGLALWDGNALVPVGRLALDLPETAEIMGWVRAQATGRFGPVRVVPPVHLVEVAHDGLVANPRRKCGFDLVGGRIVGFAPDRAQDADRLEDVRRGLLVGEKER